MTKEMIVSSNDHETTVAILEDDQLVELFIERERNRGVVGNVYKGRVSKVLPGMQSAFVDLGLERDGFLYVTDVVNPQEMFESLEDDEQPAAVAAAAERRRRSGRGCRRAGVERGRREDSAVAPRSPPRVAAPRERREEPRARQRPRTREERDRGGRTRRARRTRRRRRRPIGRASKTC